MVLFLCAVVVSVEAWSVGNCWSRMFAGQTDCIAPWWFVERGFITAFAFYASVAVIRLLHHQRVWIVGIIGILALGLCLTGLLYRTLWALPLFVGIHLVSLMCMIIRFLAMRGITTVLTAIGMAFVLASCASIQAPYVPAAPFECRLSVWPTFDVPVELLVQHYGRGQSTITEFKYTGAGGYGPRRSGVPKVHAIDAKQWEDFMNAVRKHDPWSIPSKQPYTDGLDGTTIILEIRDKDRFHRIRRWHPFAQKSERKFVEFSTAVISLLRDR